MIKNIVKTQDHHAFEFEMVKNKYIFLENNIQI